MDDVVITTLSILVSIATSLLCLLVTRKKLKLKIRAQEQFKNNLKSLYSDNLCKSHADFSVVLHKLESKNIEKDIDLVLDMLLRDRVEYMYFYKNLFDKSRPENDYYLNFIKAYDRLNKNEKDELSSAFMQSSLVGRKRFFMKITESVIASLTKFA